jgi:uncharacterized protein
MANDLRSAVLVELVSNARNIGKIQLQKLVYFLQQEGVPLEYQYEMYHYGPYSPELAANLSTLDALGVLDVSADQTGYGFHINPGTFAEGYSAPKKYEEKLNRVLSSFGNDSASQLEVKATLHFVNSIIAKKRKQGSEDLVIKKVKELKPQFSEKFIKSCLNDLKRNNWM